MNCAGASTRPNDEPSPTPVPEPCAECGFILGCDRLWCETCRVLVCERTECAGKHAEHFEIVDIDDGEEEDQS